MGERQTAAAWAHQQVLAVRDDPHARYELLARLHRGPAGRRATRHLPYRRAALSFMRWQVTRGLLNPPGSPTPGSQWWRAVNESLLLDGSEAVAIITDQRSQPSSQPVQYWLSFTNAPTPAAWYRAHNASIVSGYLKHTELAEQETPAERFFINVALLRVLYAHALVASPRLALGRLAFLAPLLGDPRLGLAGAFLSLRRVIPQDYPLDQDADQYITNERRLGRLLDYGVITPRLQELYEWSATELNEPGLLGLIRHGSPIYAWPYQLHQVWRPRRVRVASGILDIITGETQRHPEETD